MRKLLEQKQLFKILFWAWGLIIFILSSLPNIPSQKINIWDEPFRLDYIEHFGVFIIWASFLVIWKMTNIEKFSVKTHIWFVLGTLLFAAADEIHQIWIPGRTFNPLDLIYNVSGLLMGYLLAPLFLKQFYKK
ncbi:MAG: VanZ family protein [Bacteroidales bacterium]|nr:VanZ family protein [Bacteroidales bacterium]